jgi:hypothetical protein
MDSPREAKVARTIVLGLLLVFAAGAAYGGLRCDSAEINLGPVYRDQPKKIVYNIRNTGRDSVAIYEIEPSCDCTTAQAIPDVIPPGEETAVIAFFDPMGYEGRGPIVEYLRIATSDVEDPEFVVSFAAEVSIGPEPQPRSLAFPRLGRGESDTLDLVLHPGAEHELEVLGAECDTGAVVVEDMGTDSGGAHHLKVIATNRQGCGRLSSFVTLTTTDPVRPRIQVPLTVCMAGRIVAEPEMIAFGPTLPGSYVAQSATISCADNLAFKLPHMTSSVDYLEPEVTPAADGTYLLKIRVSEDAPPGRVDAEIKLQTDCPDEPQVEVGVTGYVRSAR